MVTVTRAVTLRYARPHGALIWSPMMPGSVGRLPRAVGGVTKELVKLAGAPCRDATQQCATSIWVRFVSFGELGADLTMS